MANSVNYDIKFNEAEHLYYISPHEGYELPNALKNIQFTSITKFLEHFSEGFDEVKESAKFVHSKNNKHKFKTAEEVMNYWQTRRELGSMVHLRHETADINMGAYSCEKDENGDKICYTLEQLKNLKPGVYVEVPLYSLAQQLIGTPDKFIVHEDRSIDLYDYKTNGEKLFTQPKKMFIKTKGYSDYKYFLGCISYRPCDTFQKYTYQLSTYAYFLEKLGYKINSITIIAIVMDDEGNELETKEMEVEYRKKDVICMLKDFAERRINS